MFIVTVFTLTIAPDNFCSYHLLLLPSSVLIIFFSYHLLFLPSSILTVFCSYRLLFLPYSVLTVFCSYHLLLLPSSILTIFCYYHLLFLPSSVLTVFCSYRLLFLPSSVLTIFCPYHLFCVFSCPVYYSFIFPTSLYSALQLLCQQFNKHKHSSITAITVTLSMHAQSAHVTAKCEITHKNAKYSAAQSVPVIAGLMTNSSSSSRTVHSYRCRLHGAFDR